MTTSNAINFRMQYAFPGDLTRGAGRSNVKAEFYGATAFLSYGVACTLSSGTVIPINSNLGSTANSVYGWLVRPFPLQTLAYADTVANATTPPTTGVANVMTEGYIGVFVQSGAASVVEGGIVYIYYAATSGAHIIGGVEGTTSGNNFAVTNTTNSRKTCYFTGPCDANGYTEIAFGI